MSKLSPTLEQQEIIKAFETNRVLKVNAVAGSGKSSTLRMLAELNNKPSLYVCFNKSIAEEAAGKFPKHVACKTTHSIAFAKHGTSLVGKLNRPPGKYVNVAKTPSEIAQYYKLQDMGDSENPVKAVAIASLAKLIVSRYQNSPDEQITKSLIFKKDLSPILEKHPEVDKNRLAEAILITAKKLWLDRVNPFSVVLAEHDTYLKLWQLSKPILPYEILYLDEAQDSNPAVLDVIKRQEHCKIAYVGDTYQSIYAFRQAVNAMEQIDAPSRILSKSFRYGQEIADVATFVIKNKIKVQGFEKVDSKVEEVTAKNRTYIFRTNSALIDKAVNLVKKKMNVYCNVDTNKFKAQLQSAEALYMQDYKQVKDEDITPYSNWQELVEDSKDNPELKRLVRIVEQFKTKDYLTTLEQIKTKKEKYDVLLITAHKSKGMEWSNVVIADDFPIETILKKPDEQGYNQQEVNLFYVAVTRAIETLELPQSFIYVFDTEYCGG